MPAEDRAGPTRHGAGKEGHADGRGSSQPQLLGVPPPDLMAASPPSGAGPGSGRGQRSWGGGAARLPGSALHLEAAPPRQPRRTWPSGCRRRGEGQGAGTGAYVNGDGGGGGAARAPGRGPGALGPGGKCRFSGVDSDDLAAAAADQHHPVQVLGENLKELHV